MNRLNLSFQVWIICILALIFTFFVSSCSSEESEPTQVSLSNGATAEQVTDTAPISAGTASVPTPSPEATSTDVPTPTPIPSPTPLPLFQPAACEFDVPAGRTVECGYLIVPEDHSQPDPSNTIRLHVAIFKSESDTPAPDPIIYLEGGPGGDALETIPFAFESRFSLFREDRDFIMFDQRGTGYSQPSLACSEYTEMILDTIEKDLSSEESVSLAIEALIACRNRLANEGVRLSAYNSIQNAADVNDLRIALGYDEWNLYGISYGTRLAQTVTRDYPDGIRSVILDSAYPPGVDPIKENIANADRAFDVFFAGCAADPACNEAYPQLEIQFFELVDRLNTKSTTVPITYEPTGNRYDAALNGDALIGLMLQSLYSSELIPLLPKLISDAAENNYQLLSTLLSVFLLENEFISIGMLFSVRCNEEIPFSKLSDATAAALAHPDFVPLFTYGIGLGEPLFTICDGWDAGIAPPKENEFIFSDIPTLILAGEYDPVTPPSWGALAAEGLRNSFLFEFPGIGHGATVSDQCPLSIAISFLRNPTVEPDVSCIASMNGPHFTTPGETVEEITLLSFANEQLGIEGVVPEGWEEAAPGVYARMNTGLDQTAIIQQAVPGFDAEQLLSLFAGQLGVQEDGESTGTYEMEGRTWSLYEGSLLGHVVDIAVAEDGEFAYLIVLVSTIEERDGLFSLLFIPAMEALNRR